MNEQIEAEAIDIFFDGQTHTMIKKGKPFFWSKCDYRRCVIHGELFCMTHQEIIGK